MSLHINENLLIPYPQKVVLSIQFPYEIVDIHNSFDYLEELWDEIISTIYQSFTDRGITILEGSTNINDDYTTISYELTIVGIPPYLNLAFICEELSKAELPKKLIIYTPNQYEIKIKDIILHAL